MPLVGRDITRSPRRTAESIRLGNGKRFASAGGSSAIRKATSWWMGAFTAVLSHDLLHVLMVQLGDYARDANGRYPHGLFPAAQRSRMSKLPQLPNGSCSKKQDLCSPEGSSPQLGWHVPTTSHLGQSCGENSSCFSPPDATRRLSSKGKRRRKSASISFSGLMVAGSLSNILPPSLMPGYQHTGCTGRTAPAGVLSGKCLNR